MNVWRFIPRVRQAQVLRLSAVAALAVCILVATPAGMFAQSSTTEDEEGCGCHSAETEPWEASPHGQAALNSTETPAPTCEGCHGAYVRGHRTSSVMQLTMDSGVCIECHTKTYDQWQHTQHAESGVQCIGCHLTHSQTLRLTGTELCASCHRQSPADVFHASHRHAEVSCIDCHVAAGPHSEAANTEISETGRSQTPSHDFTHVSAANCVDCHSLQIRGDGAFSAGDQAMTELMTIANRVPDLRDRLTSAEEQNRTLAAATYAALGLGTGVGAVLGIVLVLFVGYVAQRKS